MTQNDIDMICEVCGEDCRCGAWSPEPEVSASGEDLSEQSFQVSLEKTPEAEAVSSDPEQCGETEPAAGEVEPEAWRGEVAARLERYRARRKPKPPRYPSLWLEFETRQTAAASHSASMESVARDEFSQPLPATRADAAVVEPTVPAKILVFPRSSAAPPVRIQELADPVPSQPRILEVAETPARAPALGGITIDALSEEGRHGDEDARVCPASISRRLFAGLVDALVVGLACALAGAIFWQIARVRPPALQLMGVSVVAAALFWATYQYLLIVYSGSTPGLRIARLDLVCMNGAAVVRSRRRARVLASFLSGASLALGYLWALIEADSLAWHDRMTGTCLVVKAATAAK